MKNVKNASFDSLGNINIDRRESTSTHYMKSKRNISVVSSSSRESFVRANTSMKSMRTSEISKSVPSRQPKNNSAASDYGFIRDSSSNSKDSNHKINSNEIMSTFPRQIKRAGEAGALRRKSIAIMDSENENNRRKSITVNKYDDFQAALRRKSIGLNARLS